MTAANWLGRILPHLQVVRGPDKRGEYVAWCPFHPDGQGQPPHQPNLSVSERGFYCHACLAQGGLAELADKLGIEIDNGGNGGSSQQIQATYAYRDKNGTLLFEVVRKNPKGFYQRRPDSREGWINNLNGTSRVLYRLPELIARPDEIVWIVEGEKDADRLAEAGLLATTNPGGAGKWQQEYDQYLKNREVVIIPDNDDPGRSHALDVARSLSNFVASIKILRLPDLPPKGDISDWLNAGRAIEELQKLATEVPERKTEMGKRLNLYVGEEQAHPVHEAVNDPYRLARIFLEQHGRDVNDRLTIRYWRDQFWRWTGTRYRTVPVNDLRATVSQAIKTALDQSCSEYHSNKEVPRVTCHLVTNILQAISGLTLVAAEINQPVWLDGRGDSAELIAMENGLLDLGDFVAGTPVEVIDHSPEWFSPIYLPYAFDHTADCPKWQRFITHVLEGDAERIRLLQEWFGYCLTHDTSLQKFVVFEGDGANGKSVVCEILAALLGKDNVVHVPLELFGQRFQLTQTLGRLANIATEVGELDKGAEGYLKSFTSGDRMHFDRKGLQPIEAYPTARLVLATNNRPRFSDRSSGLWRRMILVPFQVTIPEGQQNPHLAAELKQELSGILNWSIAGRHRLQRNRRFSDSGVCSAALAEYRNESNPARIFLSENCMADDTGFVACATLYNQYKSWCESNGYRPLGERMFGKEVSRIFPQVRKVRRGGRQDRNYQYEGIACPM